ncbi:MAG: DUF1684 domain-containing protein [Bacteroidetes bacterium]|nr:DUF1684 domain-containing protein [Bacteroidota bacterium]
MSGLKSEAQGYYLKISEQRDSIDAEFADSATSILDAEIRKHFTGIDYFVPDSHFVVEATFKKKFFKPHFLMQTSTDRKPEYRIFGVLTFQINGDTMQLEVYQNLALKKTKEYRYYLFVPFKDFTNGRTTYGGGRYLDLDLRDLQDGKTVIDFNLCYNPYCAYNYKYSCPVPPKKNHLQTDITAGVKVYEH